MTNLLRANLFRMKRDRVFWLCAASMLLLSAVCMVLWCLEARELAALYGDAPPPLDDYYFQAIPVVGIVSAVFICMYLYTEYSEGTVRNKLTVGHKRGEVCLANFLTTAAASLLIQLMWMAGSCVGIPLLGGWTGGTGKFLLMTALVTGTSLALAAVYTFIGVVHSGKSSMVLTVLVYFTLLFAASTVYNILCEPEFSVNAILTVNGVEMTDPAPNPDYVSGNLRAFYEFLMDFLPSGQIARMQNMELGNPVRMLLSSVFITGAAALGSLALFARKDLK